MILGIVGFVAMIPGFLCAQACGAVVSAVDTASGTNSGIGGMITALTAIPMVAGLISGFLSKSKGTIAGIGMLASAAVLLIPTVMAGNWFFGLIAVACFTVGGVLSFQNK
jgi:hypothetical protein